MLLAHSIEAGLTIYDITKYGAKADGSDISPALLNAWTEACKSPTESRVIIPPGNYNLEAIVLKGPCMAPINLHVQGYISAQADPAHFQAGAWIQLNNLNALTVSGTGTFDGKGSMAWGLNDCGKNLNCKWSPFQISFNFVTNTVIREITSKDSKNFHMTLLGGMNVTFQNVNIVAPGDSVNTDGIHVARSNGVSILDTNIGTGDDCISLGDGSKQIKIERVNCGPGHGISIGSLSKYKDEETVEGIFVKNCTLTETMNGVRIKSWPTSPGPGSASDMHFEDIVMNNVSNPIIIDQEYCPSNQCILKSSSELVISNVSFKNIRGTSATMETIIIDCSKTHPCQNVELGDINLSYVGTRPGNATSTCSNVSPKLSGVQVPPACTAEAQKFKYALDG
ncbi:exopolygalacturonase-like [Impatiens glandulifera]|uniref:exopolygalacturonase-like n=1 Tax=Impatiens glandulifera TaxID=253017 RepID=UPI001FB11C50|nr:exopolygalacturonase-like [Impatiens glandulifera]